jgi:hypothetical protein
MPVMGVVGSKALCFVWLVRWVLSGRMTRTRRSGGSFFADPISRCRVKPSILPRRMPLSCDVLLSPPCFPRARTPG